MYSGAVQNELVTPTGALIATSYASSFGPMPPMSIERVGYGAGDRDDPTTPNVLRVLIGRAADGASAERVCVIECEIVNEVMMPNEEKKPRATSSSPKRKSK